MGGWEYRGLTGGSPEAAQWDARLVEGCGELAALLRERGLDDQRLMVQVGAGKEGSK